jgi:mercuric ion transport protein
MSDIADIAVDQSEGDDDASKAKLVAAGGILGAIAASSCCVIPVALFSFGISGAWIGNLTALSAYQPIFIAIALGFLGYGYYLVYRKPKVACGEGEVCARPLSNRLVKGSLWFSTLLVGIALSWPYIIPHLAPYIFG